MNLDELETLAKQQAEYRPAMEWERAMPPATVLALIAIARAADALTDKVYDGGACLSPEWTALRAALHRR